MSNEEGFFKYLWAVIFLVVLIWSAIEPKDYISWFLEVAPAIIGALLLFCTYRSFRLTGLGYFFQGFVPALLAREIIICRQVFTSCAWQNFFIICFCLAFSAFYELIEWTVAIISGEFADAFLGGQGAMGYSV
nr:DUF2238 domain-containing protein [Desulfotalea psychrophila]